RGAPLLQLSGPAHRAHHLVGGGGRLSRRWRCARHIAQKRGRRALPRQARRPRSHRRGGLGRARPDTDMPSWQSQILWLTTGGFRVFNGRATTLDVAQERRNAAVAEKMFRSSPALQYSAMTAQTVPTEWIIPVGQAPERVIVYVHGGGFYSGSLAGA